MNRLVEASAFGIEEILSDIADVKSSVEGSDSKICKAVTKVIAEEAQKNWDKTYLEDVNGVPFVKDVSKVVVVESANESVISVGGKDVAFLEFGAGVHYNGSESYPGERPAGIVGIGVYGKGNGKKDSWSFGHPRKRTHGNQAFAPMYHAARSGERKIFKIAKEVFNG